MIKNNYIVSSISLFADDAWLILDISEKSQSLGELGIFANTSELKKLEREFHFILYFNSILVDVACWLGGTRYHGLTHPW